MTHDSYHPLWQNALFFRLRSHSLSRNLTHPHILFLTRNHSDSPAVIHGISSQQNDSISLFFPTTFCFDSMLLCMRVCVSECAFWAQWEIIVLNNDWCVSSKEKRIVQFIVVGRFCKWIMNHSFYIFYNNIYLRFDWCTFSFANGFVSGSFYGHR